MFIPIRTPERLATRLVARAAIVALPVALLTGCQDLSTENINAPDVGDVFSSADNLYSAVGTSYRVFWGVSQGARTNAGSPVLGLAAMADELVVQPGTLQFEIGGQEPRSQYNNTGAGQWMNRKPYYDLYEVISTNRDALVALDNGTKVGVVSPEFPNGSLTAQTRVMAKMMLGLSYAYLGMLFDQAFLADEKTDISNPASLELKPYPEVVQFGIEQLEEAIRLSQQASPAAALDQLPMDWFYQQATTRADLERYMHSIIARVLAGAARTPAERAAVDWTRVIAEADKGVTAPFGQVPSTAITGTTSAYLQYTQLQTDGRTSNKLIGPADTTGSYQAWLSTPLEQRNSILIGTPDRRIHGAGGATTNGKYFGYLASQTQSSNAGTYFHSRYRGIRYGTTYYNGTQPGGGQLIATTSPLEMRFLKAEAHYRMNNHQQAADLINITRVANGSLPAVTVNGPPNNSSCVPRRDDGSCGDLWDALMYEKRIELFGLEAIVGYTDRRGWGKLLKGTLLHFPVTGRELETLGMPIYTFGGSLPGSAP